MVNKPSVSAQGEPHKTEDQTQGLEETDIVGSTSGALKAIAQVTATAVAVSVAPIESVLSAKVVPVNISIPSAEGALQRRNLPTFTEGMKQGTYSVSIPGVAPEDGVTGGAFVKATIADQVAEIGLSARIIGAPQKEGNNLVVDVALEVSDVDAYQAFVEEGGTLEGPLMKVASGDTPQELNDEVITFDHNGAVVEPPTNPTEPGETNEDKENWLEGVTVEGGDGPGLKQTLTLGEPGYLDYDLSDGRGSFHGEIKFKGLQLPEGEYVASGGGYYFEEEATGARFIQPFRVIHTPDGDEKFETVLEEPQMVDGWNAETEARMMNGSGGTDGFLNNIYDTGTAIGIIELMVDGERGEADLIEVGEAWAKATGNTWFRDTSSDSRQISLIEFMGVGGLAQRMISVDGGGSSSQHENPRRKTVEHGTGFGMGVLTGSISRRLQGTGFKTGVYVIAAKDDEAYDDPSNRFEVWFSHHYGTSGE